MVSSQLVRVIVVATVAAVALAAGVILFKIYERSSGEGKALIGGPFSLVDQNGRRVADRDLLGQFVLIYFGYTYCPDACPTALGVMSAAIEQLGQDGERVTPVMITVDPARDTEETLREYAASFHPRLLALRGTDEEIAAAARAYRVYFGKSQGEGGDSEYYLVDHTTLIYLMGQDGQYLAHFGTQVRPEDVAAEIRKHL